MTTNNRDAVERLFWGWWYSDEPDPGDPETKTRGAPSAFHAGYAAALASTTAPTNNRDAREVLAQAMGLVRQPDRDYYHNPLYTGDPAWAFADAALAVLASTPSPSEGADVREACAKIAAETNCDGWMQSFIRAKIVDRIRAMPIATSPQVGAGYVRISRETADRAFDLLGGVDDAAEVRDAFLKAFASPQVQAEPARTQHRSFRKLIGTKDQPSDLAAYAAELEAAVVGEYHRADQWRWIANEMGYEPDSHKHPPLSPWLRQRIAMFRARIAPDTADLSGEDGVAGEGLAGMVRWAGGDCAPADWDGGPVVTRGGECLTNWPATSTFWDHVIAGDRDNDIIAYTPLTTDQHHIEAQGEGK